MPTMLPSAEMLRSWAAASQLDDLALVLQTGDESRRIDAERPLYPASMIKLPLAAAILCEVEAGRLHLDQRIQIRPGNMTANDAPSPLDPGYFATLDELIHRAIAYSDNVATNTLFDVVGRDRATSIARERLRLPHTSFRRKLSGSDPLIHDPLWNGLDLNTHPAADAARLLSAISRAEVPGSARLRSALGAQIWNDKLSAGLSAGDRFEHKTGETDSVCHDGGILTTASGLEVVVVLYTGAPSTDEQSARLAAFMRRLRPALAP